MITNVATQEQLGDTVTQEQLDAKQDKLTFDTTPTSGSNNPVTSAGILAGLNAKLDSGALVNRDGTVKKIDWHVSASGILTIRFFVTASTGYQLVGGTNGNVAWSKF